MSSGCVRDRGVFALSSPSAWPVIRQSALFDLQPSVIHVNERHANGRIAERVLETPLHSARITLSVLFCTLRVAGAQRILVVAEAIWRQRASF